MQGIGSWADLTFGTPVLDTINSQNGDPKRDPKKDPKRDPKRTRRNYCYTCKPRGKVLKHIIGGCNTDNVIFHFDLHKRPLILATPRKHYGTLSEIPPDIQLELFGSVKIFCDFWGVKDYQVSYNTGEWQTQPHFYLKIKICEKIVNRMRRDHFTMATLNHNYLPTVPRNTPIQTFPQT